MEKYFALDTGSGIHIKAQGQEWGQDVANINWKRVLDQKHIEYIESGSGVAKGNIVVACPFCGSDAWHYMGINLTNGFWGCWRNAKHRGKSPVRLLVALLKVSYGEALSIAGLDESFIDPDGYEAIKNNLFKGQETKEAVVDECLPLVMPAEFQEITHDRVRHSRFLQYLEKRGFPKSHIAELCRVFKLRAAVSGKFKDRIIMPYYMDGELVTWTGRAIAETHLRYMDLSIEDSVIPAKHTLYNYNATRRNSKILLVAEGPFDAVTCDFYSRDYGVRCVGLSTNSMTEDQTYMLEEVAGNFEQVLLVMDNASSLGVVDSFRIKEKLATIKNIGYTGLPRGYKDFGEMPENAIVKFCKEIVNGL